MQDTIKKAPRMSDTTSNQKRSGTAEDKNKTKSGPITNYVPKKGTDVVPTTVGGKPYTGQLYTRKPMPKPKFK